MLVRAEKYALPFIRGLYYFTRLSWFLLLIFIVFVYPYYSRRPEDGLAGQAIGYSFDLIQIWIAGSLLSILYKGLNSRNINWDKILRYLLIITVLDLLFVLQKTTLPYSNAVKSIDFPELIELVDWSHPAIWAIFLIECTYMTMSFFLPRLSGGVCLVLIGLIVLAKKRELK